MNPAALDKQTAVMPEEALNEREETRLGTSTKVANGGSRVAPILEGDSAHKGDIELAHQAVMRLHPRPSPSNLTLDLIENLRTQRHQSDLQLPSHS